MGPWRYFTTFLAASTFASGLAIAAPVIEAHAAGHPVQYGNPLRNASVTGARIDQGVDYTGTGPVYAIGEGVIDMVYDTGWPAINGYDNGVFIAYHLTAGPATGREVYIAECIWPDPPLALHEHIYGDTLLGTMQVTSNCYSGIETGWANPNPPFGSAVASGGHDGQSSSYGFNFESFLVTLGAPAGNPNYRTTPYDSLPDGWPRWSSGAGCQYDPNNPNIQFSLLASKTVTGIWGGRYLGYELLDFSLVRIVNTANWTWCFQTHVVMSWGSQNLPAPTGSFEINARVSCNHSIEGEGWAIDHSGTNSALYVNTDWRTASGPCNISWGADDADGSYGSQVVDSSGSIYDYYHGTTYLTYGTL